MLKNKGLLAGLSVLLLVVAFSFQNCAQNGFTTFESNADVGGLGGVDGVSGICGSAQGRYTPTETNFHGELCFSGTPDPANPILPQPGGQTTYQCRGKDDIATCTMGREVQPGVAVNGQCGSGQGSYESGETAYRLPLCAVGTAVPSIPNFPNAGSSYSYTCQGFNGGTNVSCTATRANGNIAVNGQCGSAQGDYLSTASTFRMPFCTSGQVSPSNPTFPQVGQSTTYTCAGSNGGSSVSCSLTRQSTSNVPQNAICGSAQGQYAHSDSAFRSPFCDVGTLSSTPGFPAQGSSGSYTCNGVNNGSSVTCNFSRDAAPGGTAVNGECGEAQGQYVQSATTFRSPLCAKGVADPLNPSFPTAGGSTQYQCKGTGGGNNVSCTASRQATAACLSPNYEYYNDSNQLVCGQCNADKSYHSNTKTCVNHDFSATIENYKSNPATFSANFKIDVESEHINDATKEWFFLAGAYTYDNGTVIWKLYDRGAANTEADPLWKDWPTHVVGTEMPKTATSYPYLMLSLPEMDATALGGWQVKAGYGRGNSAAEAFNEMLSAGRSTALITFQSQAYSSTITGGPTSQIFSSENYNFDITINPSSAEYGAHTMNYYILAKLPKDIRSVGTPHIDYTWVLTTKLENGKYVPDIWQPIFNDNGIFKIANADGTVPSNPSAAALAPATLKVSDLAATNPRTYNFKVAWSNLGKGFFQDLRGAVFKSGYGTSYGDFLGRWGIGSNDQLYSVPMCSNQMILTANCQ